jgi:hypothetical protein
LLVIQIGFLRLMLGFMSGKNWQIQSEGPCD